MAYRPPFRLEAQGITAALDEDLGQLADFGVEIEGKWHRPLARVPWSDAPPDCTAIAEAPHLARMSGDFFCAPFGNADIEPAPSHGWTANSRWIRLEYQETADGVMASWRLEKSVMGARVIKRWELRHGLPFLFQEHLFQGGAGRISFAHHVMIDVDRGAELAMSPRAAAETPDLGAAFSDDFCRSVLAYPARSTELARFPRRDGGFADLTRHPIADAHDDFVMLIDSIPAPSSAAIGWAAIVRPENDDCVFLAKPAHLFPQTMLWISNGGRLHPPWNGQHRGVLGIEDACAYSLHGHRRSVEPNVLNSAGVPTSIELGTVLRLPYLVGVVKHEGMAVTDIFRLKTARYVTDFLMS